MIQINPKLGHISSFIDQFEKLLHLEFDCFKYDRAYPFRIRSKTLQTLYITQGNSCQVQSPVCENLIEFSTPSFLNIDKKSSFTSKLKYLSCKSLCYERKRVCFPSLEVLVLESQQKPIRLNDFPRLQRLHFNVVENYSEVFLYAFQAKDLHKRPLKIFLSGVHFSFERDDFDNESLYYKAIHSLYTELMILEQRTNYTTVLPGLKKFWKGLWKSFPYAWLFPRPTIDVEFLIFYARYAENFESNRIKRTILYSDSFGQALEALRRNDPNVYESLARCVNRIFFLERITSKESLFNLKDFFERITGAYLEEFDQELLDLLPTTFPCLVCLVFNPRHKNYEPINCKFISELTSLDILDILAENSLGLNDLKAILKNCKCLDFANFQKIKFFGSWEINSKWRLCKLDSKTICPEMKLLDDDALLNYCKSFFESDQREKPEQNPC